VRSAPQILPVVKTFIFMSPSSSEFTIPSENALETWYVNVSYTAASPDAHPVDVPITLPWSRKSHTTPLRLRSGLRHPMEEHKPTLEHEAPQLLGE
jgi:hypothetical protein